MADRLVGGIDRYPGHEIRPLAGSVAVGQRRRFARHRDIHRQSGARSADAGQFPAAENPRCETAVQELLATPER